MPAPAAAAAAPANVSPATVPVITLPGRARNTPPAPPAPTLHWTPAVNPELLIDSREATTSILDSINGAKESVSVSMFSLQPSGSGARLASALSRKAREGVEVNLVMDRIGSRQMPGTDWASFTQDMRDAGVNVILTTNPFAENPARRHVDHRKAIVVDGTTAYVGGMNFAKMYDGWHDVMVRYEGPAAAATGKALLDRWQELGGAPVPRSEAAINRVLHQPVEDASTGMALLANTPHTGEYEITGYYLDRIRNAQHRLWVVSPFISDRSMVEELASAARRGVDVRVLSNNHAMHGVPVIPLFTRTFYEPLLKAGAKVYEIPQVTHAKALVADDEATVGSFNLSRRAAWYDHELNIAVRDGEFQDTVEELFLDNFERSTEIRPQDLDTLPQRLMSAAQDKLRIEY